MIKFKGCKRCGGDLETASDLHGKFIQCLQCGHLSDTDFPKPRITIHRGRLKAGRPPKNRGTKTAA